MKINKNKLIIPRKTVSIKEDEKNSLEFINEVYINALKYFSDDNTADKDNILPSSMFLYSLGDKEIYENENEDETLIAKKENKIKLTLKPKVENFGKSLLSAMQFRIKDRKFILDLNTYKSKEYKNFMNMSFNVDNSLTYLILNNLQKKLLYKETDIDKNMMSIKEAIRETETNENFSGLIDNFKFQGKLNDESVEKGNVNFALDGYFKSLLQEWKVKLEDKSKLKNIKADVYPHIEMQLLDNSKYISILVSTPYDINYVDNKTYNSDKIFDCSLFIYDNTISTDNNFEKSLVSQDNLNNFKNQFKFYLSKFINDSANYTLQSSMDGSMGEASEIARYWYSEGIGKLFQKDILNQFDNDSNSNNFYAKFIEELLCKVKNINKTEIYPFDRVFIFPNTGIDDIKTDKEIEEVIVVEAHMKSTDPQDKGGYIASWEGLATEKMLESCQNKTSDYSVEADVSPRLMEDVDLNFSDKRITKFKWSAEDINSLLYKEISDIKDDTNCIQSNLLLGTLLLSRKVQKKLIQGRNAETNKLTSLLRKNRQNYDEMGIYYEYNHGLSLASEFPYLFELQNKYLDKISESIKDNAAQDNDQRSNNSINDLKTKYVKYEYRGGIPSDILIKKLKYDIEYNFKSKVVVVSFDPKSIQNNEESDFFENAERNSFTMVFVADLDFSKSVAELNTEIKDFKVLIQMVVRQLINYKANEKKIQDEQKRVRGVLDSSIHNIKSFLPEQDLKKKVDYVLQDALSKLNSTSLAKQYEEFVGSNVYEDIFKKLLKPEMTTIEKQINSYNIDLSNLDLKSNNTIFPNMKIQWDDTFIPEAFNVLLKNAVEYASSYSSISKNIGKIIISMKMDIDNKNDFLIINIINNTPEISKDRFNKMNNASIDKLDKDLNKDGSTGIGVVQARRQIQGINTNNNIIFTMIDKNIINVEMKLKIERLYNNELFIEDDSKKEQLSYENFKGVLYFEDSSVNYLETNKFLEMKKIPYIHSLCKINEPMKTAGILITDMSILNKDGEVDKEEGLDTIYDFREQNSEKSPIIVFSDGVATQIKREIKEHLNTDSQNIIILEEKDYHITLQKNKIYIVDSIKILNNKHTMILNYIQSNIQNNLSAKKAMKSNDFAYSSNKMLNDDLEYDNKFHDIFSSLKKTIKDNHFYTAQQSVKDIDMNNTLEKWIEFRTERPNKPGRKYSISNTTYHKNTLLVINDMVLQNEKEKWWLFYLGTTNNIYFNFNNTNIEEIISEWNDVAIKRESTGYLAKLRHDIKNIKAKYDTLDSDSNLESYFQTIIDKTSTLQNQLQRDIYESIQIYLDPINLKNKTEFNFSIVKDVESNILSMIETLEKITNIMQNYNDNENILHLSLFRKILMINYDACNSQGVEI